MSPQKAKAHAFIAGAYDALAKQAGFTRRPAQENLSIALADAFIDGVPVVAEAPTGTGKTLAYAIGALAAAQTLDSPPRPVVFATGTKLLQSQLVDNDLPKLQQAGVLDEAKVVLAKGRSNWLCLKRAEETADVLQALEDDPEMFVREEVLEFELPQVREMLSAYRGGRWNGDFDLFPGPHVKERTPVAALADTCPGNKCEYARECAYFRARARTQASSVVVANQDLLLADVNGIAQESESVLPGRPYLLVVDEAHHFPDKALALGSTELNVLRLEDALQSLAGLRVLAEQHAEIGELLAPAASLRLAGLDAVHEALARVRAQAAAVAGGNEGQVRFARGSVPAALREAFAALRAELSPVRLDVVATAALLKESTLEQTPARAAAELRARVLKAKDALKDADACLEAMLSSEPHVRWLDWSELSLKLCTSPLEGADVLRKLFWPADAIAGRALVSATLRDLGTFNRYKERAGLPPNTRYVVLPPVFDYSRSQLVVPYMAATPKPASRQAFVEELGRKLPAHIAPDEGTLVLFSSWAMMRALLPALQRHFGEKLLVQGQLPARLLVARHRERIDQGLGSVLVGVASLAEGLDLPGRYCEHVVIAALPFAVPTDAREMELADRLGDRYFAERSLPDAMVRLVQMCGRLLRRETDRGKVTVFDRRLADTNYGRRMLRHLPPLRQVIEPRPRPE